MGAPIIPCSPANCNRSRNSPVRSCQASGWASALRVKSRWFAFQQGITHLAWSHSPCSRSGAPAQERTASEAPASFVGMRRQKAPSSAFRNWSL